MILWNPVIFEIERPGYFPVNKMNNPKNIKINPKTKN
jgi:hypothetical protein